MVLPRLIQGLLIVLLVGACSKGPGGSAGGGGNTGSGGTTNVAPLDCVLPEGYCDSDDDCCVAPCLGFACFHVPDGYPCRDTKECRNSSACIDGACAPVSCRNQGMPCNGTGCCDGLDCVDQFCVPETCNQEGESCFPACCPGMTCKAAACTKDCGLTGAACAESADCCDGYFCEEGTCQAVCSYGGCGPSPDGVLLECCQLACSDGGLCQGCNASQCTSDAECCDGAPCVDGKCGCVESGGACGQSGACCDGLCKQGACACIPKGEACTFSAECCGDVECTDGICKLSACQSNLETCDHETDCCEGVCTSGACCTGSGLTCPSVGAGCCDASESCIGDPPTCRSDCVPPGALGCMHNGDCCDSSCDAETDRCRALLGQDCSIAGCHTPLRCGDEAICCRDRSQACKDDPTSCCDNMVCENDVCCIPDGEACVLGQGCCGKCEYDVCVPND